MNYDIAKQNKKYPVHWFFICLALIGLVLSVTVHVFSLLNLKIPFGKLVWFLHGGIFVVWIPVVIIGNKLTDGYKRKNFWKAALRGCPKWMKGAVYFFIGYAVINFIIFAVLSTGAEKEVSEAMQTRGFSGHWMFFYSVAAAVLYSATKAEKVDKNSKCPNGHSVSPTAKYCEECGAPILELGDQ